MITRAEHEQSKLLSNPWLTDQLTHETHCCAVIHKYQDALERAVELLRRTIPQGYLFVTNEDLHHEIKRFLEEFDS